MCKEQINMVSKAYDFAKEKHGNTLDDEGKNYFDNHVLKVACALVQLTNDKDVICAGYLHDVIEDCGVTYEEIKELFGERVADLVMEVTQEGKKDSYGYYFPRLKTAEGIMIKLIDRVSNISRMGGWDEKRKAHYLLNSRFWKNGK